MSGQGIKSLQSGKNSTIVVSMRVNDMSTIVSPYHPTNELPNKCPESTVKNKKMPVPRTRREGMVSDTIILSGEGVFLQ